MKRFYFFVLITILFSCNQAANTKRDLQKRIDSLEKKQAFVYTPGLGEMMSGIQAHHSKLWFAGKNKNWKLADFEVHEIMETVDAIQQFQTKRKESKMMGMISPALDSLNVAIQKEDSVQFKNSFILLTSSCNNCHHATNFEFNVVKIPDVSPFSNQDFRAQH